ncbi:mitochondrial pyruvate carrier 1 [Sarotherodon galilaeus]
MFLQQSFSRKSCQTHKQTNICDLKLFCTLQKTISKKADVKLVIMPESERPQHTYEPRTTILGCILVISCIMFIAQVIAALATDECKGEPYIPMCILNYGFISAFLALSMCTVQKMQHFPITPRKQLLHLLHLVRCKWCNIGCCSVPLLLVCFLYLGGNLLLYSDFKPNFNKSVTTGTIYCNKTFYLFAFWSTNLTYGLLALLFITFCCCKRREPDSDDEAQLVGVQHYRIIIRILWVNVYEI